MAQKVTVALEDDLDCGPPAETARFAFDDAEDGNDMSAENTRAFRGEQRRDRIPASVLEQYRAAAKRR
jgi:hypothetical protein